MEFTVIDKTTGKEADIEAIALNEEWAKGLCYCDMDGFAITDDGCLVLLDECGNFEYCDEERFEVKFVERTCTYVEHVDVYGHYYQCLECQHEMNGGEFEHYKPAHCMGCGSKIKAVVQR